MDNIDRFLLGSVLVVGSFVAFRLQFPVERPPGMEYHYKRAECSTIVPYVIGAHQGDSPKVILKDAHGQGDNFTALCFDGPLLTAPTGNLTPCFLQRDTAGNLTVAWDGDSVKSIEVVKDCR